MQFIVIFYGHCIVEYQLFGKTWLHLLSQHPIKSDPMIPWAAWYHAFTCKLKQFSLSLFIYLTTTVPSDLHAKCQTTTYSCWLNYNIFNITKHPIRFYYQLSDNTLYECNTIYEWNTSAQTTPYQSRISVVRQHPKNQR